MKIVQLNNYHYVKGGSERVYFELTKLLIEAGHHVSNFSILEQKSVDSEWGDYFAPPVETTTSSSIASTLTTAGRMLFSAGALRPFEKLVQDFCPEIVHGHNIYSRLGPRILKSLSGRNIPAVITLHDYKLACSTYTLFNNHRVCEDCITSGPWKAIKNKCTKGSALKSSLHALEAYMYKVSNIWDNVVDAFVCPSNFSLNLHARIGIPKSKLHFIPNFVDPSDFNFNSHPDNYFIFVGRLSSEKGLRCLLNAVKETGCTLKIAGTGPILDNLSNLSKELCIERQVSFLGHVNRQMVKSLIQNAIATIVPSEWYENAPMSILESLSCGTPVIGSRIGGIPEMVIPGKTGLLFEPNNASQLAGAIKSMSNASFSMPLRESSRQHVIENNSPNLHLNKTLDLYRSLIKL